MYQMEGLIADLNVNTLFYFDTYCYIFTELKGVFIQSVSVFTGSGKGHGPLRRAAESSSEAQPAGAPSEVPQGDSSETAPYRGSV